MDETDDEDDFPATLEAADVTDAVTLLDLGACFVTYAMSLFRMSAGRLVIEVPILFAGNFGLMIDKPTLPLGNVLVSVNGV